MYVFAFSVVKSTPPQTSVETLNDVEFLSQKSTCPYVSVKIEKVVYMRFCDVGKGNNEIEGKSCMSLILTVMEYCSLYCFFKAAMTGTERKALNKYYPPDFDPRKLPKVSIPRNRQYVIRVMAPFNMKCNTCGEYIYKGKKFNARRETVEDEDYIGLSIFRFYIRCPQCLAEITFKTDLKNCDYAEEHGATRLFEAEKMLINQLSVMEEEAEKEKGNAMLMLEKRTKMSRFEMEALERLEDLKELNKRQATVDYDALIEQAKEEELAEILHQKEEEDRYVQSVFENTIDKSGPSSSSLLIKRLPDLSDEETDKKLETSTFVVEKKPRISKQKLFLRGVVKKKDTSVVEKKKTFSQLGNDSTAPDTGSLGLLGTYGGGICKLILKSFYACCGFFRLAGSQMKISLLSMNPESESSLVMNTSSSGNLSFELILRPPTKHAPANLSSPCNLKTTLQEIEGKLKAAEERRLNVEAEKVEKAKIEERLLEAAERRKALLQKFQEETEKEIQNRAKVTSLNREKLFEERIEKIKDHEKHVEEVRRSRGKLSPNTKSEMEADLAYVKSLEKMTIAELEEKLTEKDKLIDEIQTAMKGEIESGQFDATFRLAEAKAYRRIISGIIKENLLIFFVWITVILRWTFQIVQLFGSVCHVLCITFELQITIIKYPYCRCAQCVKNSSVFSVEKSQHQVVIHRKVYNLEEFDEEFDKRYVDLTLIGRAKKTLLNIWNEGFSFFQRLLSARFPCIKWLLQYNVKKDLPTDVLSGITVGVFNIPQGMAYGMLAGTSAANGLYTSFYPPLIYSIFGSSNQISIGTFSVISLMTAGVIAKFSHFTCKDFGSYFSHNATVSTPENWFCGSSSSRCTPDVNEVTEIAMSLAFLVGVFQILLGLMNMGFLSVYLSDQLVEGLTTGSAVLVFTSQIRHVFGIKGLPDTGNPLDIIKFYGCFFIKIDYFNWLALVISAICILSIIVVKQFLDPPFKRYFKFSLPFELFLVIATTAISYGLNLNEAYSIDIVGKVPKGLVYPRLPRWDLFPELASDAIAISVVIYSICISLAKLNGSPLEWSTWDLRFSLANAPALHLVELAGVFAAAVVMIVLLFLAGLLTHLPKCVLASVIIVALKGMFFQMRSLPKLWRCSKPDFLIWVVSFCSVVLLDITYGLLVSVAFALLTIVFKSQPDSICLGRIPKTELYRGLNAYAKAEEIPGVKIYRFDSPLFFANVENFRQRLYECTGIDPIDQKVADDLSKKHKNYGSMESRSTEKQPNVNSSEWPVTESKTDANCSSFPFVDLMGVESMKQIYLEYKKIGIAVKFAYCKVSLRQILERTDFFQTVPKARLYPSIEDAVAVATCCSCTSF
ncbi:Sulfate transporter [Trichinella spiralis]|uniref:Splicing factor YJU2 n=1 Tax=Trichinella spiralis TaxID=6334 RepID=A0A0V1BI93_TRISP|nr:Sulfate transporter [Trichinella spiralis]